MTARHLPRLIAVATLVLTGFVAPSTAAADGPTGFHFPFVAVGAFPEVRLYLNAWDDNGGPVNFSAADLSVSDSGQAIPPAALQIRDATTPVALALLIDNSDREWLARVGPQSGFTYLKGAGGRFLSGFLRGHQLQALGYELGGDSRMALETGDNAANAARARVDGMGQVPQTWLYDRVDFAIRLLEKAQDVDRRALVVVSDGNDVDSVIMGQRDPIGTLVERATAARVTIFTVGGGPGPREAFLRRLAEGTQGFYSTAPNTQDLDPAFRGLLNVFSQQKIVSYQASCTGKQHGVTAALRGTSIARTYDPGDRDRAPQVALYSQRQSGGGPLGLFGGDRVQVVLDVTSTCEVVPGTVRADLGGGLTVAPASQEGGRYTFDLPPSDQDLPGGSYRAQGIANNGLEGRSTTSSDEFSVRAFPLLVMGLMLAMLSLGGGGILYKEWSKPRPVDAFLEPYYEGGPKVWPDGTQFYLKTVTTIGRSGGNDIQVPSQFKNIHAKAVRLTSQSRGGRIEFKVKLEADDIKAWLARGPVSADNNILREGDILSIEGVSFRLMLREPTAPWTVTGQPTMPG